MRDITLGQVTAGVIVLLVLLSLWVFGLLQVEP
jgi:hypothetical protein